MELIVQKLTELAITDIIFFPSDYSVFKIFPDSKVSRLKKIMVEAAEQSRNYFLPNLVFLKSFDEIFFTNFKNFYW
jgi:RsmE family RNA methyltransferase